MAGPGPGKHPHAGGRTLPASPELSLVFVDDERPLLDLIREYLEIRHPEWKATYFTDPVDALMHVRQYGRSIDVIVCDVRMPFASGLEILDLVRKEHPRICRITLSGHIDSRTLVGAGRIAELNLCKPVRVSMLCERILELVAQRRG